MADPLPNYLRTFRKRSGLAQREVARLLGVRDGATVSRYERGEREPGFIALVILEFVYGARLDELFRGRAWRFARAVRRRAQSLHRHLNEAPRVTPGLRHKLDFLTNLIYPPRA